MTYIDPMQQLHTAFEAWSRWKGANGPFEHDLALAVERVLGTPAWCVEHDRKAALATKPEPSTPASEPGEERWGRDAFFDIWELLREKAPKLLEPEPGLTPHETVLAAITELASCYAARHATSSSGKDAARLDWLDKNGARVQHAKGYNGSPDRWFYDSNGIGRWEGADDLRAAIDAGDQS